MSLKKLYNDEDFLDSPSYADKDTQKFEALNEQITSGQSYSNRHASKPEKPVHHHFTYSEADAKQFQKILPDVNATETPIRETPISDAPISDEMSNIDFGSAYKQSDNDQFRALMNFNDSHSQNHDSKIEQSNNENRSFSYSELDLLKFNQLANSDPTNQLTNSDPTYQLTNTDLRNEPTNGDLTNINKTFPYTPKRSERNFGSIKIKEFDGKTKKSRKMAQNSNRNIKVRYFD